MRLIHEVNDSNEDRLYCIPITVSVARSLLLLYHNLYHKSVLVLDRSANVRDDAWMPGRRAVLREPCFVS